MNNLLVLPVLAVDAPYKTASHAKATRAAKSCLIRRILAPARVRGIITVVGGEVVQKVAGEHG
jgi:hypothetical protein